MFCRENILIYFDSFAEKIHKQKNIFNQKINETIFSEKSFSKVEKKEFLENSLIHFKKTENTEGYFFSLLALSEIYFDLKLPNLNLFNELTALSESNYLLRRFFFKDYIFLLIQEGDIEGGKEKAKKHLHYLESFKINEEIISLISDLDKKIKLEDWLYSYWLRAVGRIGDLESFNKIYRKYRNEFLGTYNLLPNWYKELHKLWEKKEASWWTYDEIYMNKLVIDLEAKDGLKSISQCHDFLMSLHKYLVIFGADKDKHNLFFEKIRKKFRGFGLDFKLSKKKISKDSQDLTVSHEKIDERDRESFILKRSIYKNNVASSDYYKEVVDGEKKLLTFIKKIPFEKFERNLFDWVICFIQMRAFSILDYFIFNLENNNRFFILSKKNKLEYEYLVCEIYYLKKDWEKVLIRTSNILDSYELLEADYLPILYLKGEALKQMGRFEEAQRVFLEIGKINPSYRIVGQRLEDIGKNK